jgi:hypothetical protein
MLKAYPSKNFFEAGPQIGLAISHKEEYDGLFSSSQNMILCFDWEWTLEEVLKLIPESV